MAEIEKPCHFEPSKFCKNLYQEYSKLILNDNQEQKNESKSKNKTCLNLAKGDQACYPHFKPHIFLIEDIADSLDVELIVDNVNQKDNTTVSSKNTSVVNPKSTLTVEQIIADHSKTGLWSPSPDQVIITQGEDDANSAIIRAMCEPGDNVVIATPGNPKIAALLKSYDIEVREFPINYISSEKKDEQNNSKSQIDNWEYNVLNLAKLIDSKTKFVYTLNPNWAISQILPDKSIKDQINTSEDRNVPLVVDETFVEFPFPGLKVSKFASFNKRAPVISINSASRLFGLPGMNFGWIVLYGEKDCFSDLIVALNKNRRLQNRPDDMVLNAIEICYDTIDKVGYTLERMKIIEIRNMHFNKIFDVFGMRLGSQNCGFWGLIYVDMEVYKEFENITKLAKAIKEQQNQNLMPGDAFGAGNVLRYDNCIGIQIFKEMLDRLREFSKNAN